MFEEIKAEPVWVPNHFPDKGRLKLSQQQIENNYKTREKEKNYNCSRNFHISLSTLLLNQYNKLNIYKFI